jgi:hypothetical protein
MIESTAALQTLDLHLLVVSLSFIPVFVTSNDFPSLRFQVALEAPLVPPTPNNPDCHDSRLHPGVCAASPTQSPQSEWACGADFLLDISAGEADSAPR